MVIKRSKNSSTHSDIGRHPTCRQRDTSGLSINSFALISRYAIYIPLFLPISLPVLLSLRQAIRWYRGKDNTDEKDEQKDKQDWHKLREYVRLYVGQGVYAGREKTVAAFRIILFHAIDALWKWTDRVLFEQFCFMRLTRFGSGQKEIMWIQEMIKCSIMRNSTTCRTNVHLSVSLSSKKTFQERQHMKDLRKWKSRNVKTSNPREMLITEFNRQEICGLSGILLLWSLDCQ